MKRYLTHGMLISTLACATALPTLTVAQTQSREHQQAQEQQQIRDQDIYGWELMTPQEREAYRARMRNVTDAQERERIRNEHHAQMQDRARQRGVALPDAPPARGQGRGMGPRGGAGPGGGMGPSSGMGQGRNR